MANSQSFIQHPNLTLRRTRRHEASLPVSAAQDCHKPVLKKNTEQEALTEQSRVLTKAVIRAAEYFNLNNKELGQILGLSNATMSRLKKGEYSLEQNTSAWQLAVMVVRIFEGLDGYMGGHRENVRAWLNADNAAFNATPLAAMARIEGLSGVMAYVEFLSGR